MSFMLVSGKTYRVNGYVEGGEGGIFLKILINTWASFSLPGQALVLYNTFPFVYLETVLISRGGSPLYLDTPP